MYLSGKTTLLNLIANRIAHNNLTNTSSEDANTSSWSHYLPKRDLDYSGSGEVLFNGRRPSALEIRQSVGYGKCDLCIYNHSRRFHLT